MSPAFRRLAPSVLGGSRRGHFSLAEKYGAASPASEKCPPLFGVWLRASWAVRDGDTSHLRRSTEQHRPQVRNVPRFSASGSERPGRFATGTLLTCGEVRSSIARK